MHAVETAEFPSDSAYPEYNFTLLLFKPLPRGGWDKTAVPVMRAVLPGETTAAALSRVQAIEPGLAGMICPTCGQHGAPTVPQDFIEKLRAAPNLHPLSDPAVRPYITLQPRPGQLSPYALTHTWTAFTSCCEASAWAGLIKPPSGLCTPSAPAYEPGLLQSFGGDLPRLSSRQMAESQLPRLRRHSYGMMLMPRGLATGLRA